MNLIVGGRRTGKTTQLLKYMVEHDDVVMICPTHQQADGARRLAKQLGYDDLAHWRGRFLSMTTAHQVLQGTRQRVVVDDLDMILSGLFGRTPVIATAAGAARYPTGLFDRIRIWWRDRQLKKRYGGVR